MIDKTLRKVSLQLEALIKNEISVDRALDLLEASTNNLEEIVAINIMRESLQEVDDITEVGRSAVSMRYMPRHAESVYCHA